MKIALCVSGQPRNVDRGIENILQNMKFDFDIFAHAWWDNESHKTTFKKRLWNGVDDEVSEFVQNDWISEMYNKFDVKKIVIEEQKQFDVPELLEKRKLKFTNTFNVCSGLYGIWKCNQLKKDYELENNFMYDWIIRIRYDFGLAEPLNIDNFDNNFVYIPSDNSHKYGFNDQFAVGSSLNMDIYSGVFPKIEQILKSNNSGIYTADYCDKPDNMGQEQLLQKHLENNNIKFELLDFKNFLFRDKDKRTRIHSIEG
jgi:hypothetical protein